MDAAVAASVRRFISENFLFREDDGSLPDTESLIARGLIDSMGVLELVEFLEETYQIQVADHEIIPDNLDSVAHIVAYVERKRGDGR